MAHIRQSRQDSGPDFQVEFIELFQVVPRNTRSESAHHSQGMAHTWMIRSPCGRQSVYIYMSISRAIRKYMAIPRAIHDGQSVRILHDHHAARHPRNFLCAHNLFISLLITCLREVKWAIFSGWAVKLTRQAAGTISSVVKSCWSVAVKPHVDR